MTIQKLLCHFLKSNKKLVSLTFMVTILANTVTILLPITITAAYGLLFSIEAQRAKILSFLPFDVQSSFSAFIAFFMVLVLLKGLLDFSQRFHRGKLGELLVYNLRSQLFDHQLRVKMQIYDEKGIGKYLLRYSGDLNSIKSYLTNGIVRFSGDVILVLFAMMALWWVHEMMALVLSLFLIVMGWVLYFLNQILYQAATEKRNQKSGLLAFVNTRLLSMLTIQTFNKHRPEVQRFEQRSDKLYHSGVAYQHISSIIGAVIPFMLYVVIGLVLAIAFWQKNTFQPHTMLFIVLLIVTMLPVFRRIFRVSMTWKKGKISIEKLIAILNLETAPTQNLPDLAFHKGMIRIRGLCFGYQKRLFDQLSFTVRPQQITNIVGPTGSGKTTLIKLLTGIYQPEKGIIQLDKQDITAISPKSLRKHIAVIADEWNLYGRTVFEAISYSPRSKYKAKSQKTLHQLQQPLATEHHLTIQDKIGDFGNNLSKGQRKLLLYARALRTNKPILLIDHPFEGLDAATTQQMVTLLEQLKRKKTIVLFSTMDLNDTIAIDKTIRLAPRIHKPIAKIRKIA